jgi:hypothetical protein
MLRKQAATSADGIVRQDLRVLGRRAAEYRERRRQTGVLRAAHEAARSGSPGPSCLRDLSESSEFVKTIDTTGAEDGSHRSVRFDLDGGYSVAPGVAHCGFVPAHWTDEFHELDGTYLRLIVHADRRKAMQNLDRFGEGGAEEIVEPACRWPRTCSFALARMWEPHC